MTIEAGSLDWTRGRGGTLPTKPYPKGPTLCVCELAFILIPIGEIPPKTAWQRHFGGIV